MTTGDKIKDARKAAGMTQKQLAEALGVSETYISQYERNARNPKLTTLFRIATALGCKIDDLHAVELQAFDSPEAFHRAWAEGQKRAQEEGWPEIAVAYSPNKGYTIISGGDGLTEEAIDIQRKDFRQSIEQSLLREFRRLNDAGQQKAIERVEELTEIPKYQREDPAPADGSQDD